MEIKLDANEFNNNRTFFNFENQINLNDFKHYCELVTDPLEYPYSIEVQKNIPIYDGQNVLDMISTGKLDKSDLMEEWHKCLLTGPGVLVINNMYSNMELIESVNQIFFDIVNEEKIKYPSRGDYFAPGGMNDKIWNSVQKMGQHNPEACFTYFSNPLLNLVSTAWLGPGYQITAQVNIVKPGAQQQVPHRDYHLGLLPRLVASSYPLSMHIASQLLTLQGVIVHNEWPIESGPTCLLPHSQKYPFGYLAFRDPNFREIFDENHVQLHLRTGAGVFFNPAVYHAAGGNKTKSYNRIGNLLQISSSFGKPMEKVNNLALIKSCYPHLANVFKENGLSIEVQSFIAAVADGYQYPTNLDISPPTDGSNCNTQADILVMALKDHWGQSKLINALEEHEKNRRYN